MQILWRLTLGLLIACIPVLGGFFAAQQLVAEHYYKKSAQQKGIAQLINAEKSVALRPEEFRFQTRLAEIQQHLNRPKNAKKAIWASIATRPSWPYAWDNLLQWHAANKLVSDELDIALMRSAQLGYNSEYLAWRRVAAAFDLLHLGPSPTVRQQFKLELQRAMRVNREKLLGFALVTDRVPVICESGLLPLNQEMQAWCETTPWFIRICMADAERTPAVQKRCDKGMHYWWAKTLSRYRLPVTDAAPATNAGSN